MQLYTRLKHFKEDLETLWNLTPLESPDEPCLFFGVYDDNELSRIKAHKGLKIVWFVNAMGNKFISELVGVDNLVVLENPYLDIPAGIRSKKVNIPYKDYSMFRPNRLGGQVYCYTASETREEIFQLDKVKEIVSDTPYEFTVGYLGMPMKEVKELYYDNCFVNINLDLSGGGGWTTIIELGMMGRKTISNSKCEFPSLIGFKNEDEIAKIIIAESEKIGTAQERMSWNWVGDEWLDIKFWEG